MNSVTSFLEQNELEHLVPTFAKNKLDDITLLHALIDEELKELLPFIGDRKKFQIALKTQTIAKDITNMSSTSFNTEMTSQYSENTSDIEETPAKRPKLILSLDQSDIASTSSNIPCRESVEISSDSETKMADVALNAYDAMRFDLKNLLMSHITAILLKFEKTKSIDNKDRNHLCDIIICHFLNQGIRLNNTTISILADKIVEIFIGEKKSTYVSPIGKKSRYNRPEIAKGKLIDKNRNKLTILRKTLASIKPFKSQKEIQVKESKS